MAVRRMRVSRAPLSRVYVLDAAQERETIGFAPGARIGAVLHSVTIAPRRIRVNEPGNRNACDSLRVIGFQAVCRCGWEGATRRERWIAVEDATAHRGSA